MSPNESSKETDALVQFFLPHLTRHIEAMAKIFSKVEKKDFTDAEWLIILNERQSGKLLNHHYLSESWEEMEQYLKQKTKLFCFLDEKQQGLVEQVFTFWVFFSPAVAAEYFKSQPDKPKHFSAQSIRPVPFPNLEEAFLSACEEIFEDESAAAWQKLENTADMLKMSDRYLPEKSVEEVDQVVKRKVIKYLNPEITQLQEEITGGTPSSTIMERRLRSILRIGWRYFRAKNELETKYFRKLISDQAEDRIKGLKLAKKKLIDFELEMAE